MTAGGEIADVGTFKEVRARRGAVEAGRLEIHDHGNVALIPALVNAHTHLELTGMKGVVPLPQPGFPAWLGALMPVRAALSPEAQVEAALDGERQLVESGVSLCGDITNGALLGSRGEGALSGTRGDALPKAGKEPVFHESRGGGLLRRKTFLEILGFNRGDVAEALGPELWAALGVASAGDPDLGLAAHSCYSVSAPAIVSAKEWGRRNGRGVSIHVAEHPEEVRFLATGDGFCRELLQSLGRWEERWMPPRTTPVGYLDRLGALDENTLLVHAVHLTEADWEIVAARGCGVCFCPRSNRNTGVGRAAIGEAARLGIRISLGTDSLASNTDLDLFSEAAYVLDGYPDLRARDVLGMITLGGARVLGLGARYGSLGAGRAAALLAVDLPGAAPVRSLEEAIVYQGAKGAWRWAVRHRTNCGWEESGS